jgi:indole-3-glycerol phosphate synthase
MTFLDEILKLKRARLIQSNRQTDYIALKAEARRVRRNAQQHSLRESLRKNQISVIAEIKRASPSKGIINAAIDVAETARSYERGGACAISVLTEEDRFQGSLNDLIIAKSSVELPILRKDFIFDEFQIYEAAANGADAVLLIAAMLDDKNLTDLYQLAERELSLDVLLEVHTLEELERAKTIGAKIIGVNNRDLHSFAVSLDVSRKLVKQAPKDSLLITESGLQKREDLLELRSLGFSGFLIGETLMKSGDAEKELRDLTADELG